MGVPLFDALVRGDLLSNGTKFARKKLGTLGYHMVKIRSLYLIWAWFGTGS